MSATPRITLRHLRGACREQRAIFKREWPNGAPLTIATARKAVRLGLDVKWLGFTVLNNDYATRFYAVYNAELRRYVETDWADAREFYAAVAEAFVRIYRDQLRSGK